jgi:hypothetical protein
MAYNTQNYWVLRLCPSSDILKNQRIQLFGNWICFRLQVMGETPTWSIFGLRLALSNGTNRVDVSPTLHHLRMETDPVSEKLYSLVFWNTGRWTKSKNPVILSN